MLVGSSAIAETELETREVVMSPWIKGVQVQRLASLARKDGADTVSMASYFAVF